MNFVNSCYDHTTINDVNLWLSKLYFDDKRDMSEFEIQEENMKLLSDIMHLNKEADKDAKEVICSEKRLAQFYKEGASEMSSVLEGIFSVKDLPLDIRAKIEKIANVACQMDLKDPSLTNFLMSSAAAENKKMKLLEKGMIDTFTISKMLIKIRNMVETNKNLKREFEILEKTVNVQQPSKLHDSFVFMNHKAKEYKMQLEVSQKNLKALEYDPSLDHRKLVQRAKIVQELEEKFNDTASKLESYQNLPPNEMLSRLKIEEAKHELMNLKKEFDAYLNQMAHST